MIAPTHILVGLATTIAFSRHHQIQPTAPALCIMLIGSLLPDIDGNGVINRPGTLLERFLPNVLVLVLDGLTTALGKLINASFGHRGFLHAPLLGAAITVGGVALHSPLLFWLGWGYFWHIAADALTLSGVPILYPFSRRQVGFTRIRTGSWKELVFALVLLFYVIIFGFGLLPQGLQKGFSDLWQGVKRVQMKI